MAPYSRRSRLCGSGSGARSRIRWLRPGSRWTMYGKLRTGRARSGSSWLGGNEQRGQGVVGGARHDRVGFDVVPEAADGLCERPALPATPFVGVTVERGTEGGARGRVEQVPRGLEIHRGVGDG